MLDRNQINRRVGLIYYIVRHSGWKNFSYIALPPHFSNEESDLERLSDFFKTTLQLSTLPVTMLILGNIFSIQNAPV